MMLKKSNSKQHGSKTELPLRVLIGTCPGTKKDAESMARSQIERYFDMPDRAWIRIKELPDIGYLYEAHEAGEGKSYLDSITALDLAANETLILKPVNGHAVEIVVREGNVLQSLILPEKMSAERETDPRLKISSMRDMQPYATTGSEWIKAGVAVIAMGLLTVTVGGVLHKSYDIALQGYDEIAATLPATRLLNLAERSVFPGDSLPSINTLPMSQWKRISTQPMKADEVISRLYFEEGEWGVDTKSTQPETDSPSAADEEISVAGEADRNYPGLPVDATSGSDRYDAATEAIENPDEQRGGSVRETADGEVIRGERTTK